MYWCRSFLDAVRFQGLRCHLGLADHLPQFHARALNPAGKVKSCGLTRFGLDAMRSNALY